MKRKWKPGEDRRTYSDANWERLVLKYFPSAVFYNVLHAFDVCRCAAISDDQRIAHCCDDGSYSVPRSVRDINNHYLSTKHFHEFNNMLAQFAKEFHDGADVRGLASYSCARLLIDLEQFSKGKFCVITKLEETADEIFVTAVPVGKTESVTVHAYTVDKNG